MCAMAATWLGGCTRTSATRRTSRRRSCCLSYGAPALSPGNYYLKTPTESGFVTFGAPNILEVVTHVATAALRAAWCQKWHLHMRLRPEVFGARIHQVMVGNANYPIHSDALNAQALKAVYSNTGSYLLPMPIPKAVRLTPLTRPVTRPSPGPALPYSKRFSTRVSLSRLPWWLLPMALPCNPMTGR